MAEGLLRNQINNDWKRARRETGRAGQIIPCRQGPYKRGSPSCLGQMEVRGGPCSPAILKAGLADGTPVNVGVLKGAKDGAR